MVSKDKFDEFDEKESDLFEESEDIDFTTEAEEFDDE